MVESCSLRCLAVRTAQPSNERINFYIVNGLNKGLLRAVGRKPDSIRKILWESHELELFFFFRIREDMTRLCVRHGYATSIELDYICNALADRNDRFLSCHVLQRVIDASNRDLDCF